MTTIKKNLKSMLILGGFVAFAILNAGIISGIFGGSFKPGDVFGYGGGGGGSYMPKDTCPNGDFSSSVYDGTCGTAPHQASGTNTGVINSGSINSGSIIGSLYSDELNDAYLYAYSIGITTMPTIQLADMEGYLTREDMAKMMANYAVNVLGKTPDTGLACNFTDVANETTEMQGYITKACQLGLMGVGIEEFNPNGVVIRAEFGTVLSRALYGTTYNGGIPYYLLHLNALKANGIITNTDPNLKEVREYVMLMLMRAKK